MDLKMHSRKPLASALLIAVTSFLLFENKIVNGNDTKLGLNVIDLPGSGQWTTFYCDRACGYSKFFFATTLQRHCKRVCPNSAIAQINLTPTSVHPTTVPPTTPSGTSTTVTPSSTPSSTTTSSPTTSPSTASPSTASVTTTASPPTTALKPAAPQGQQNAGTGNNGTQGRLSNEIPDSTMVVDSNIPPPNLRDLDYF